MAEKHGYLRRDFWVEIQKNWKPSDAYTEKGNAMYKESIDRIVENFTIRGIIRKDNLKEQ